MRKFFTFSIGAVLILAISTAGLYHAYSSTQRISTDVSTVESPAITVGTPWAGTILQVMVRDGDNVTDGQELMTIQSPALSDAVLESSGLQRNTDTYRVEDGGNVVLLAPSEGIIRGLPSQPGSLAAPYDVLATISTEGDLVVRSRLTLTAQQFSRIGADPTLEVQLPSGQSVQTQAISIEFDGVDANQRSAVAEIVSRSDALPQASDLVSGMPVTTFLLLEGRSGFGTFVGEWLTALVTPDGFRQ